MKQLACLIVAEAREDASRLEQLLMHGGVTGPFMHCRPQAEAPPSVSPPEAIILVLAGTEEPTRDVERVRHWRHCCPDAALLVLGDADDDAQAARVLEAGAEELMCRTTVDAELLARALRHGLIRHRQARRQTLAMARMAAALEGGRLGVWDWLLTTDTFTTDARYLAHLGFTPDDIYRPQTAEQWLARTHPEDLGRLEQAVKRHLDGESARYQCEFRARHRDGHWVWLFESGHIISRDAEGRPLRMVGMQQDISERKSLEARLTRLAFHDELTGLYNRRSFMHAMDSEYARLRRQPDGQACVLMLDIDHFKRINDTFGHAAGDRVLETLGRTLAGQLREIDTLGRLGGEEFGVLLANTCLEDAVRVGEKLRQATREMRVSWQGATLEVTTSVGVARLRNTDQRPDGALSRADAALYAAKQGGRDQVRCETAGAVDDTPIPPCHDAQARL